MGNLSECSTRELIEELEKRNIQKELTDSAPKQLENKNFAQVIAQCQSHIDDMCNENYCDDNDNEHWIYEAAMEAVFGKDVWNWINNIL